MKLFVKLLIAALVLAVLLPFTVLKGKDGGPLLSFADLKAPNLKMPQIPGSDQLPNLGSGGKKKTDIIYQWRDEQGELHFTNTPPAAGIEYTAKGYDPNANLIQSIDIKHDEPDTKVAADTQIEVPAKIGNPYSPEKVEKLFNDAQKVQKLLDERMKQQEAILGRDY